MEKNHFKHAINSFSRNSFVITWDQIQEFFLVNSAISNRKTVFCLFSSEIVISVGKKYFEANLIKISLVSLVSTQAYNHNLKTWVMKKLLVLLSLRQKLT